MFGLLNDIVASAVKIVELVDERKALLDVCEGGAFRKSEDGKHLFLFVNPDSPKICYHCSKREGGE